MQVSSFAIEKVISSGKNIDKIKSKLLFSLSKKQSHQTLRNKLIGVENVSAVRFLILFAVKFLQNN